MISESRTWKRNAFMARKLIESQSDFSITDTEVKKLLTKELWTMFETNKHKVIRDELHSRYTNLAVSAAKSYMKHKMPYRSMLDYDDILSHAHIGLLDCIHSYSLSGGAKFETWAFRRIRGAIIDGLRQVQNFPRIIAKIKRCIEPLQYELRQRILREPTISDLIENFPDAIIAGLPISELRDNHLIFASVFNQECRNPDNGNYDSYDIDMRLYELRRHSIQNPSASIERIELISTVNKILAIDRIEQQVIYFYYFVGMTYVEISDITNLSQASISLKKISGIKRIKQEAMRNKDFLHDLQSS